MHSRVSAQVGCSKETHLALCSAVSSCEVGGGGAFEGFRVECLRVSELFESSRCSGCGLLLSVRMILID